MYDTYRVRGTWYEYVLVIWMVIVHRIVSIEGKHDGFSGPGSSRSNTRTAALDCAHTITEAPIGCVQGVGRAWGVRTANKGQLRSYSYVKVSTEFLSSIIGRECDHKKFRQGNF